ncbi:hypothetical protein BCEP4_2310005 [Burkholderia cepacia]|nr:hypothetical protein BCEP4_2310005 [Burkholderia cepacia]
MVRHTADGDLEPLTQVIHESRADNGGSQEELGEMNIEAPLEVDTDPAEPRKPSMRALCDPAMSS